MQLRTNCDLYLAIDDLSKQYADGCRSLETYLLAILNRSAILSDRESLTLSEFYELIACGFTHDPASFNDTWRDQYDKLPHKDNGYAGWHATVIRQIVDLREMNESGTLKNELRYFGVSAPRESYWYNFAPLEYLECAMVGSFGGWESGDETGRRYVPGPVAVLADDGSIQSANPKDLLNPEFEIPMVTWEHLKECVICGQIYE
ncbi:MAG: hypothetical protein F6K19_46770 [Cyanothece sp. SIO1E1]|nr:hypothetical protein [Cyanothece sp. SIO1E1]